PVDALFVATKAVGLAEALARVHGLEPAIVLPLLNGLDHLDLLRERYGRRAVAGSIRIESTRTAIGEIEQTSRFLRIDMASGAAVARAEGAEVDPAFTIAELDDAHPELRTSMQRDIAAGREPELEAIAGSVLRAAARHGIGCPEIERLSSLVAERSRRNLDA